MDKVRGWVLHRSTPEEQRPLIKKAVDWLGEEDGRWASFLASSTWKFDAPDLDGVRRRIADRLTDTGLPLPDLVDRLVWRVLEASIQEDPNDRLLTSADREQLVGDKKAALVEWAATPHATRLQKIFTDAKALTGILASGERDLSERKEELRTQPSFLLQAAYQVVPFEGREKELGEVLDCATTSEPTASSSGTATAVPARAGCGSKPAGGCATRGGSPGFSPAPGRTVPGTRSSRESFVGWWSWTMRRRGCPWFGRCWNGLLTTRA